MVPIPQISSAVETVAPTFLFALNSKAPHLRAIEFVQKLKVPTGKKAGKPIRLAPFQRQFIRGAFGKGISVGVLSVARGNGKSALSGGLAVAELFGAFSDQPRREVLIAASKRDQAEVAWTYCHDLIMGMAQDWGDEERAEIKVRYSPKLELEWRGHKIRAIAADGKGILGTSPTLVIMDERAAWDDPKGQTLEDALLTGALKRQGRTLIISTGAATDAHAFSRWLDEDEPSIYRQDHRAPPKSKPDDADALAAANPGAKYGIAPSIKELQKAARRAASRGGSSLTAFRLLHLNERISDAANEPLVDVDDWLSVESEDLPERQGKVVIGLDLGGAASMSAAAYYWPQSGRLEVRGWFPTEPSLADRGRRDRVGNRYEVMAKEGTLSTIGHGKSVPISDWIGSVVSHVEPGNISTVLYDTYKQSEIEDGLRTHDVRAPGKLRRFGPYDGGEDVERFRRAVYERQIAVEPTMLMRSAMEESVCRRDGNLNPCLDKSRSLGRIDAASAAVLAVAEGSRIMARPLGKVTVAWA